MTNCRLAHPRSCKSSDTLEIFTYIFDIERVLLQPANSLLQPAKKVRIKTKFRSFYKTLYAYLLSARVDYIQYVR